ncbi:uncharacterized protein LOC102807800, partial [Saccoglossus kowalevskii]
YYYGDASLPEDDALSTIACPVGMTLMECSCQKEKCDGTKIVNNSCVARNSYNALDANYTTTAVAKCLQGDYPVSIVKDLKTSNATAVCPVNTSIMSCNAMDPWSREAVGKRLMYGKGLIVGNTCYWDNCGNTEVGCSVYANCLADTTSVVSTYPREIPMVIKVFSSTECALLCLHVTDCKGYLYNRRTGDCDLSDVFSVSLSEAGLWIRPRPSQDYMAWFPNDHCVSSPCENGGTCQLSCNHGDGFICKCRALWTGILCETRIPYEYFYGVATVDLDDKLSEMECPIGMTLITCECDVKQCDGASFMNTGTCVAQNDNNNWNNDISTRVIGTYDPRKEAHYIMNGDK